MAKNIKINVPVRNPDGCLWYVSLRMSKEAFASGAMRQIMDVQLSHFGVTLPEGLQLMQLSEDADEYTSPELAATIQPK